jgi:CRP/FNR family cyclic AMP-dependent transcriptional regulator
MGVIKKTSDLHAFIIRHVLKRIELTEEQQQYFCSLLTVKQLLPKQYLLEQGQICNHETFVCKGFLRSFTIDEKGNDNTLHFAFEDWWITDSTSMLQQIPSTRNIIAQEASVVLQIDKTNLDQLYKDIPAFERFWRILDQNSAIAQNQRILNSISMNGEALYKTLIQKYPTLEQRLPQKHIASYLGISPVFLSQIRKNLARGENK